MAVTKCIFAWIDKVTESPPALCAFCLRLIFVLQPTAAKRTNFSRAYGAFCLRRCISPVLALLGRQNAHFLGWPRRPVEAGYIAVKGTESKMEATQPVDQPGAVVSPTRRLQLQMTSRAVLGWIART